MRRRFIRLFTENWRAKLMSIVVASVIWYLLKRNLAPEATDWRSEDNKIKKVQTTR